MHFYHLLDLGLAFLSLDLIFTVKVTVIGDLSIVSLVCGGPRACSVLVLLKRETSPFGMFYT